MPGRVMKILIRSLSAAVFVFLTIIAPSCGGDGGGGEGDADADTDTDADTDVDADECIPEDDFNPMDCPGVDLDDTRVRYVNGAVSDPGEGGSWAAASNSVQDGIDACRCVVRALGGTCQVWVAQGTYLTNPTDRCDTFWLRPQVEVYGGFAGVEVALAERDWVVNATVLGGWGIAYHVVTGADGATIDGFTITGGHANGGFGLEGQQMGGGMLNRSVSPTVINCTFVDNWASLGGGMANREAASPTVTRCTFLENVAYVGGGVYNDLGSAPTLSNCRFSGNSAVLLAEYEFGGDGGGMRNNHSSPILVSCVFDGNSAQFFGGGIANADSDPVLTNCSFTGNSSSESGGAIDNLDSSATLTNCILWGDSSESGPEIFSYPPLSVETTVTYSDVEGGCTVASGCTADETGNIDADPLFVDAASGDLHLQDGSPCIDMGSSGALPADVADLDGDGDTSEPIPYDLDGNPRVVGASVDMGAYETQD